MTNEEKQQLLLKDLCARLPYGVKCHYNCVIPMDKRELRKGNCMDVLKGIIPTFDGHIGFMVGIDKIDALEGDIKPCLRPMSSMTEEEKRWYHLYGTGCTTCAAGCAELVIDWLNSHHFDYRGLIEEGLALEAPEGMYNF